MRRSSALRAIRYLVRISVIATLAAGTLWAQPAGRWGSTLAESDLPKRKAQWIWLADDSEAEMLLARKAFHLPEAPDRALLSITATSQYQLFVNGKYWWLDGTGRSGTFRPIASGRSDAQTESAFFPGLFARYILGIEPAQPGLRDVVLRYYPCSQLPQRRGAMPTPSGILGVAWEITPSEFEISLQVPTNTTVRVDLASLKVTSPDHILRDGELVSPQPLQDGFLNIPEGDHTVRVKRM